MAASAHGFVSVGSHDGQPAVWMTGDGRSWETIVLPVPDGASTAVLQQVAISSNRVVALGQATMGTGPASGTATGSAGGTVPFAELSLDGGATWQQVPFSSPGPDTAFTALTADAAGFTAAGLFGQPGQQDVAVWTSATGATWKPSQSGGLNGSEAWQIDALAPSGSVGDRHRDHRHSAEPADHHLHPPRPLKGSCHVRHRPGPGNHRGRAGVRPRPARDRRPRTPASPGAWPSATMTRTPPTDPR